MKRFQIDLVFHEENGTWEGFLEDHHPYASTDPFTLLAAMARDLGMETESLSKTLWNGESWEAPE